MAYPEKDAEYKHKPAWLDRAMKGEKEVTTPYKQSDGTPPKEPKEKD